MIPILISAEAYVIPVEVAQTPWHYTTFWEAVDHWQTGIAGVLAFVAGVGTVLATMIIARRQIAASRDAAERVIMATREQTETAIRLERMADQQRDKDRADRAEVVALETLGLAG